MEFLAIVLGIIALMAGVFAIVALVEAISDGDPSFLLVTLFAGAIAVGCGIGSANAWHSYQSNWYGGDAVVRNVFVEDGNTMLLTNKGDVYRCVDPTQCGKLVKGDHITFEQLPKGSAVRNAPDVRNVTKG